jgi:hypothetical protein
MAFSLFTEQPQIKLRRSSPVNLPGFSLAKPKFITYNTLRWRRNKQFIWFVGFKSTEKEYTVETRYFKVQIIS